MRLVGDGARIVAGPGLGAPTTLLGALGTAAFGRRWTLSTGLLLGDYPFLDAVRAGELTYRTWHVMPPVRELVAEGLVGYVPARFSQVPAQLAARGVDVALVRVSPPDVHGYCSLGPSAGYTVDAVALASVRIGEVDPALPRTFGGTAVHRSMFDALVESQEPTPRYESGRPDAISNRVAAHVLGLLPRDPTLQIGIGSITEAVVSALGEADLGGVRFCGMATDEMVDLFERGVIAPAGARVPISSPELMGTEKLMAFADRNPALEVHPASVTHDAARLGRIDRFVSVNTAIEVDLSGQVNSERVRGRQVSGPGGSLDFVEAATRSAGGVRIIALSSTTPDGRYSRIVGAIGAEGAVTIPRSMVDAVVTEYGVARLDGRSTAERAEALVAVAHPDHRDALTEQAGHRRSIGDGSGRRRS